MSNFITLNDKRVKTLSYKKQLKNKVFAIGNAIKTFAIDYFFPEIMILLLAIAIVIGLGAFMATMFVTL